MWQLSSSVPGPPCLLASPPVTLGIVLIMPPPRRGRCCHHGPPLTELSAHLLGLHTCTPLFWACWVPGLCQKCVLLFKPPSGACCTCPSPPVPSAGLLLACLPAASKLGCSASSVPEKKKKKQQQQPRLLHSSPHIVLLSSFSAAERNKKCKRAGRSQLKTVLADGATSTLCWQ